MAGNTNAAQFGSVDQGDIGAVAAVGGYSFLQFNPATTYQYLFAQTNPYVSTPLQEIRDTHLFRDTALCSSPASSGSRRAGGNAAGMTGGAQAATFRLRRCFCLPGFPIFIVSSIPSALVTPSKVVSRGSPFALSDL